MTATSARHTRRLLAGLGVVGILSAIAVAYAPAATAAERRRTVAVDPAELGQLARDAVRRCNGVAPAAGVDIWQFRLLGGRIRTVTLTLTSADGRPVTVRSTERDLRANGTRAVVRVSPAGLRLIGAEAEVRGGRGGLRMTGACTALVQQPAPPRPAPPRAQPAPQPPRPAPPAPQPTLPAPVVSPELAPAVSPAPTPTVGPVASPTPLLGGITAEAAPSPDGRGATGVIEVAAPAATARSDSPLNWTLAALAMGLLMLVSTGAVWAIVRRPRAAAGD